MHAYVLRAACTAANMSSADRSAYTTTEPEAMPTYMIIYLAVWRSRTVLLVLLHKPVYA